MVEGQLVIVSREEGILVSFPSSMLYVEATEESLETSFQALEVVSNAYVKLPPVQPCLSSIVLMVARVMLGHEYELKMSLGRNGDGMASLVEFKENRGRFGLGYKPTCADVRKGALERRGKSMGQQQWPLGKRTPLCHISESFISTGWVCEGRVAMIHDEVPQEHFNWVQSCLPEFELGNWQIIERLGVFMANIM